MNEISEYFKTITAITFTCLMLSFHEVNGCLELGIFSTNYQLLYWKSLPTFAAILFKIKYLRKIDV